MARGSTRHHHTDDAAGDGDGDDGNGEGEQEENSESHNFGDYADDDDDDDLDEYKQLSYDHNFENMFDTTSDLHDLFGSDAFQCAVAQSVARVMQSHNKCREMNPILQSAGADLGEDGSVGETESVSVCTRDVVCLLYTTFM